MRDEINKIYDIFKSIICNEGRCVLDESFVNFIKKNELYSEFNKDEELLKLSVLSSHQEWEALFQAENINLNDCLGSACASLSEKGIDYFDISPYELKLLREEVVDGNNKYSVLMNDTKKLLEAYNKKPTDFLCRYLILNYLQLHRVERVRYYVEELKSFKKNVLLDYELPIHIARLYDEIIFYDSDEDLYDIGELQDALDLFEETYEMNKRLNIVDPVVYAIYYIKTIWYYLHYLDSYEHNFTNKYTKFHDQPKNIKSNVDFIKPRYKYLNSLNEDLVFKADASTTALIEKHDDLILSMLPFVDDIESYNIEPIFKGTKTFIWKCNLNKSFPDKLDYFLISDEPPHPIIGTFLDIKRKNLKERLYKEFNTEENLEILKNHFIEDEARSENEDVDNDDYEEDIINPPTFYDDDYSLRVDDFIKKMSEPDWKSISLDSYILHDLRQIIQNIEEPVKLRIASCKAISLLEYEYADVLLVKALRDQEDAVKESALEGLINLKKPIDEDCFEVLSNFSNKEITNPIILRKIHDAIDSGLIKKGNI